MPHRPLLELEVALQRLLSELEPLAPEAEPRALTNAAGCYAAEAVAARSAVPPFANAAMDGYAMASSDPAAREPGAAWSVTRRIFAGQPPGPALPAGSCARIFTGAALPPGSDCVIAQEDAELLNADRVRFRETVREGHHVRLAGSDLASGDSVVLAGEPLTPARLALLAATGVAAVRVHRSPRVALLSTGDELRDPGAPLAPGQIYDSNAIALQTWVRQLGLAVTTCSRVGDDPAMLRQSFQEAIAAADVLICCGGVSVGDADHVRAVLAADGEMHFWRLALKPGKPFAFGRIHGRPLLGLPGNPVSAWVTFALLARPALLRLAGASTEQLTPTRFRVPLSAALDKRGERREFQRGRLLPGDAGPTVTALPAQGSHQLSALSQGDCLIDLPAGAQHLRAGSSVAVIPLTALTT